MVSPGWTRDIRLIQPVRFMVRPLATSEKIRSSRIPWSARIPQLGFQVPGVVVGFADPYVSVGDWRAWSCELLRPVYQDRRH